MFNMLNNFIVLYCDLSTYDSLSSKRENNFDIQCGDLLKYRLIVVYFDLQTCSHGQKRSKTLKNE